MTNQNFNDIMDMLRKGMSDKMLNTFAEEEAANLIQLSEGQNNTPTQGSCEQGDCDE